MYHNGADQKNDIIGFVGTYTDETNTHPCFLRGVERHEERVWSIAQRVYGVKAERQGFPIVLIPHEFVTTNKFGFVAKSKGSCEYQAVGSFIRNLFGVTLDSDDSTWFQKCPLVRSEGVPMANTLRVAQELIAPYHLKVSRVRVTPGLTLPGDLAQWEQVLGCNPLASADRSTSNEEFAAAAGITQDEVDKLFRFEFGDKLMRPAITCATGGIIANITDAKGTVSVGGHSQYRSPRAQPFGLPWLQFQLDRADRVVWQREPVFEHAEQEEEEEEPEMRVSLWLSKSPDGKMLSMLDDMDQRVHTSTGVVHIMRPGEDDDRFTKYKSPIDTTPDRKRQFEPRPGGLVVVRPTGEYPTGACYTCDSQTYTKMAAPHICVPCWSALWRPFRCTSADNGGCNAEFSVLPPNLLRMYRESEVWYLEVECANPGCGKTYRLPALPKYAVAVIIKDAIFGKRPSQQDHLIMKLRREAN